jgi:pyridoxamine 5'-phosphate oxidase
VATVSDDVADLRREYSDRGLDESALAADPMTMFAGWFADVQAAGLYEPNAMVVSTVSADGRPSSRMVLLKGFSDEGFVFFTNQASRKGVELAAEPRCALLFPWHPLERQVRVEGTASVLPGADVAAYFSTRPRGSRLGAHASHQSRVVASRAELEAAYDEAERTYPDEVPVPGEWGGYRVRPEAVEFWQGRPGRMHDRLVYRRAEPDGWRIERLAP